jgi:hypothetical protein
MRVGQIVKIKETSIFAMEVDRHNPTHRQGTIIEIGNETQNTKRSPEYPILVSWGDFTNTYRRSDLEVISMQDYE